jgi:hypothetical protein
MNGPGALDEPLDLGQPACGERAQAVSGGLVGGGEQVGDGRSARFASFTQAPWSGPRFADT